MDYIARLNKALDEQELYDDMEEHGRCVINTNLVCQECGGCFDCPEENND